MPGYSTPPTNSSTPKVDKALKHQNKELVEKLAKLERKQKKADKLAAAAPNTASPSGSDTEAEKKGKQKKKKKAKHNGSGGVALATAMVAAMTISNAVAGTAFR